MSFAQYKKYKDSGVEWIGKVPEHWKIAPLKRIASLTTGLTPPTDDQSNYSEDDENRFPWIRPEDLNESGSPSIASKFLSQKGWKITRKIHSDASLICCIGTIGKIGFTTSEVCTNQQITAAHFEYSPRFFYFTLTSAKAELETASTGNVLKILNTERLGQIIFPCPPTEESDVIAAFLDRETAKIDALITEQRRLIELLKEKRQAVISHAVTKGLTPDVQMKDSGVEWISEVPKHWEISLTKRFFTVRSGDMISADEETEFGFPIIGGNGLRAYTSKWNAPGNTLVIGRVGAHCGCVHYIKENFWASEHAFRVIEKRKFSNQYFFYLLTSIQYNKFAIKTAQPLLNTEIVETQWISVPPLTEQIATATFLDRETAKIDTLITESNKAIELLKEKRISLISAAVTGKIDVRDLVPQESL